MIVIQNAMLDINNMTLQNTTEPGFCEPITATNCPTDCGSYCPCKRFG